MALHFPTRAERPGSLPHAASLQERTLWPEFLYHDPVLERLMGRVVADYAELQFYAWDDEREEVVGAAMTVPAAWDRDAAGLPDGGLDAVVEARFAEGAAEPTVLCALQILTGNRVTQSSGNSFVKDIETSTLTRLDVFNPAPPGTWDVNGPVVGGWCSDVDGAIFNDPTCNLATSGHLTVTDNGDGTVTWNLVAYYAKP